MSGIPVTLEDRPQLLDAAGMQRALVRLAHELIEHHEVERLLLAGVQTRGVPLAQRLATLVGERSGIRPEACSVSVAAFRDDRPHPLTDERVAVVTATGDTPAEVTGRTVVLVDDVLFTGRTVRAAIDALLTRGRPAAIEVLVLIDRGHRELPVRATYVGKNVPTRPGDRVHVRVREVDGVDGAWLTPETAS